MSSSCRQCAAKHVDNSGQNNPRWKGGHKHWSNGRYGKDKDGLSWKVQRKLAWERDQYTCQHCGKTHTGRKPDVHHIDPWLNSMSHALDNLICLCKSCHMKEDAKVHEQWGGKLIQYEPRTIKKKEAVKSPKPKNTCPTCGEILRVCGRGKRSGPTYCKCHRDKALSMWESGATIPDIMQEFQISQRTAYYWVRPK